MRKDLSEKELIKNIKVLRKKNKKIVLCHGVFDVVHLGHIKHLESAKKLGDYLVVSITADAYVKKGITNTLFNQYQRSEFLRSINNIDMVYISESESAVEVIKLIRPDFYVKGSDYKNDKDDKTKKIILEKKVLEKNGGKIIYTNDIVFSSSNIKNTKGYVLNKEQQKFITNIKKLFDYSKIEKIFKSFQKLKVTVIGELIIDKYCFGDVMGKSGKEPHLVLKEKNTETYIGGSGAVARHISSFIKEATLISPFGHEKPFENLVKNNFSKNIKKNLFKPYPKYQTIVKQRFVDSVSKNKLLGSYLLPENNIKFNEEKIIKIIKKNIDKTDLLLVCDYGHNFITKKISGVINNSKKFISLNAQINASNIGFHTIDKYTSIKSFIINEGELRHELRDNLSEIAKLGKILIKKKKIENLIITRGSLGAIYINKNKKVYSCPAFATHNVDKVGAGDAMLAISSLALKLNLHPSLVLFLGSLAAAISVQTIGNKEAVNFKTIDRMIDYILK